MLTKKISNNPLYNYMTRTISLFLTILLLFSFTACNNPKNKSTKDGKSSGETEIVTIDTTAYNQKLITLANGDTTGNLGAGAVFNNGTLAIDHSDTVALANDISGTGNLNQMGTGTTVLTGNNSYTGQTSINAGILQVGAGGTSGKLGTGAITNNGTLVLDRSDAVTVGNDIGGTGAVVQQGSGTTVLSGNNSYQGGTSINAGTVQVDSDARLGAASGALALNGGSLQTTADTSSQRQITLGANGGNFSPNAGTTLTAAGAIQGAGGLTQAGAGTLVLAANNSYVGQTTINAGTLQVGNGGTSGNLGAGAVNNNGTLVFDRSDVNTVNNTIAGTGGLTQAGTGTTVLTGNTSYGGSTNVNVGALNFAGASNTLGGDVNVATGAGLGVGSSGHLDVGGAVRLGNGSALSISS